MRGFAAALAAAMALTAPQAHAVGARLFKSGPIQITADGATVWVVNTDDDSVSRLDTATDAVTRFPLPAGVRHAPRGLSVSESGAEVWVACHDSDRVLVLSGADGSVLADVPMGWGSGPYSVALSRDQRTALVTLHRAEALAVVDVPSRTLSRRLSPVYWSPLGVAWMEDGVTAWVTHLFADGEDPFLTRVDVSGPVPKVKSKVIVKSTNPKHSSALAAPYDIAEGGYLTFRGHLAQVPSAAIPDRLWIPTQYNNINEDVFTPDSTVQSTIRTMLLSTRIIGNTNNDKVILTAVHVHDPQGGNNAPYVGPGWDLHVSGPVDVGFSADGRTAYVLFEQSNDLVMMPTNLPAWRQPTFPGTPPREIPVGMRPLGLAVSPVADVGYAWNSLDSTVSIVSLDPAAPGELRRVSVAPPPLPPTLLRGALMFHSSEDPDTPGVPGRLSVNEKIACASCHPHAEHDGRVWDFQHLPGNHGPRSSMSMLGLFQSLPPYDPTATRGQLHRSGDRDELEDFDHTFQGVSMLGTGLAGASLRSELGPLSNRGRSTDLDALADYLLSLPPLQKSPHRDSSGALTEAATRGATFFRGSDPRMPADANCATCHVPATGFVDLQFHDVGQRRPPTENELQAFNWTVNTPTLVGAWTTPPYDGVTTYASTMLGVLKDMALPGRSSPHGTVRGLTGRQLRDLAEMVLSIDGAMSDAEVAAAVDAAPPRVVRVEPASLTRVDVWFSESVEPSAAVPSAWTLTDDAGASVAITAATWDGQNGDRITLTVDRLERACPQRTYSLAPAGTILDMAARATGGTANALDNADPANTHAFPVGDTFTLTLGASGYENVTVRVHDAATIPGLTNWSHGSTWLDPNNGANTAFVRFDWQAALAAATGLTNSGDILDASFSLQPEWGDVQRVSARRLLLPWIDNGHTDWDSSPTGAPTFDRASPARDWNQDDARATSAGIDGRAASDYNGTADVAATPDAVVDMDTMNERFVIGGAGVTDAFRFWFDNPTLDNGFALRVVRLPSPPTRYTEAKFTNGQSELQQDAPVLTITYQVPVTSLAPPPEVSAPLSPAQLLVAKDPAGLRVSFEDLGPSVAGYHLYAGNIGPVTAATADWYSHAGIACGLLVTPAAGGRVVAVEPVVSPRAYLLVTAANACLEGPSGSSSVGPRADGALLDCLP